MTYEPKINNVIFVDNGGRCEVSAHFTDGRTRTVCTYFTDELTFRADEFIGLTEREAHELHHRKDKEYLQS